MTDEITYERRVVAFLDILGFSALVDQTARDPTTFSFLYNVLSVVRTSKPRWDDPQFQEMLLSQFEVREDIREMLRASMRESAARERMTSFSDCAVISSPADSKGVGEVLQRVEMVAAGLLTRGILVRGGITAGHLCHHTDIVFGPAMIEAYRLESKVAHYPRVLISDAVLNLRDSSSALNERVILDADGMVYLDTLGAMIEDPWKRVGQTAFYKTIRAQLQPRLDRMREGSPDIVAKYAWFVSYFTRAVERLKEVSSIQMPDAPG